MASQKKENVLYVALLMTVVATLVTSENIDCNGKAFYCVNSTHFKICVDLGGGVSKTVDDFLIPCPINTACKDDNYFECEYQLTTTLAPIRLSDVTNEIFEATNIYTLENYEATTLYPENNLNKLEELRTDQNLDSTANELKSTVIPIEIVNGSFTSGDITTELVNFTRASEFINTNSDIKSESDALSSIQDTSFGSSTKSDYLSTTEKVMLIDNLANDLFPENVSNSQDHSPQTGNKVTESYPSSYPVLSNDSYVANNRNYEISDLDGANISLPFETLTLSTLNEIYDNLSHLENTAGVVVSDNLNKGNTEVPSTTISSFITTDTTYTNTELITSLNTDSSNLATNDSASKSRSVVTVESTTNIQEIDISTLTNTEKYVDNKPSQVIFNFTDIFQLETTPGIQSSDSEQTSNLNVVDFFIAQTDKALQSSSIKTLSDKMTTEMHKDDIQNLASTEKLSLSSYMHVTEPAFSVDMSSMYTEQTPYLKSLDSLNLESIDFKSHPSTVRTHIDDMTTDVYKKQDLSTAVITEKYLKKAQPESTTASHFFEIISTTDPNGIDTNQISILNNLASILAPVDFKTQQSIENHVIDYDTTDIYKIGDITTKSLDTNSTTILNNLDSSTYFGESSTTIYKIDDLIVDTVNTTITNTTKMSETKMNLLEPLPFKELPTILVTETLENINPEIHNTIESVNFQEEVKNNSEYGSNQTFLQSTENILAQVMFEQSSRVVSSTNVRNGSKLSEINISLYSKDNSSKNSLLSNGSLNITLTDLSTTNNPLTSNTSLENESETIKILAKNIDSNYSASSNILPIISEITTETNLLEIRNNIDNGNKLENNITKIDYINENINETSIFESTIQEELSLLSTESYVTAVNVDISNNSSFTLKPNTIIEISENSTKGRTDVHLLENKNENILPLNKMNVIPAREVADFVVTATEINNKEEETTITNIENIERVNGAQNDLNMSIAEIVTPNSNQEIKKFENSVSTNKPLIINFSTLNVSENVQFSSDQLLYNNLSSTNNLNVPRENMTATTYANSASVNLSSSPSGNVLDQINVQNYTNEHIISEESLNNFTERAVTNYDSESSSNIKKDSISNKNKVESINTKNNQPTIKSIAYTLNTNVSSNKENQPVNTQNDTQVIKSEHIDNQPQFTVIVQDLNIDKYTTAFLRNLNYTQANHRDEDGSNNTVQNFNYSASTNNKNKSMMPGFNNSDNKREILADDISRSSSIINEKPAENIHITTLTDSSKVNIIDPMTNFEYFPTSPMTNLKENNFDKSSKQNVIKNLNVNQISTVNSSSKNDSVSQNNFSTSHLSQKLADENSNNKTLIQLLNYTAISQNTSKSKSGFFGSSDSKTYLDGNNKQTIQKSTVKSLTNETMDNTYSTDMRPKMQFTCASRPRGRYSDENNCNNFYICIGKEEPIIGTCPVDTVFSEINKQCTKNLSHCIRNNQFKCLSSGRFVDILSEHFYYICVRKQDGYVRYKLQCQKGYHLNKVNIQCTVNTVSYEESSKNSSDKSTDERKSSELTLSSNTKKKFECVKEGKYEFPDDCRKYYVCIKNNKSEFRRKIKKCDSDEVFNNKKRKCVDVDSYEC